MKSSSQKDSSSFFNSADESPCRALLFIRTTDMGHSLLFASKKLSNMLVNFSFSGVLVGSGLRSSTAVTVVVPVGMMMVLAGPLREYGFHHQRQHQHQPKEGGEEEEEGKPNPLYAATDL